MTKAAAVVQRLADILTAVVGAAVRSVEDLLDPATPQAVLVPVRVRQANSERRR